MSNTVIDVIGSLVALGVGFMVGQIIAWRIATIRGKKFLVPTAHPGPRTAKMAGAVIIVVALASLVSGIVTQSRLEQCNENFRDALIARSDAAGEIFEIITDLQVDLARAPGGLDGAADRYSARQDFVIKMEELQAYRAGHPLPDIECGVE